LKKSGICPKCNSENLSALYSLQEGGRSPHLVKYVEKVLDHSFPQRVFVGNYYLIKFVCEDCGFIEFYKGKELD